MADVEAEPSVYLANGVSGATAKEYILRHDRRAVLLDNLSNKKLRRLYLASFTLRGMVLLVGGDQSHDEYVNHIVDMEYPDAERARRIYHQDIAEVQLPALGQE